MPRRKSTETTILDTEGSQDRTSRSESRHRYEYGLRRRSPAA